MAISPKQTKLTPMEMEVVTKIEDDIDTELMRYNPPGKQPRSIIINLANFIPSEKIRSPEEDDEIWTVRTRYLPVIVERYRNAGWNTEEISNDDTTSTLNLSPVRD